MTSDPRILFVDQTGNLGGAELCLADLATHLRSRCAVFLFESGPFQELLEKGGVRTIVVRASAPKANVRKKAKHSAYFLTIPAFIWLVVSLSRSARGFDLLYANTAKALIVTAVTGLLLRKPFLFHLHDIIDVAHFSSLNRWLLVTAANLADGIVANSEATAAAYRKAGGTNRNLRVVPNGFRVERFRTNVEILSREIRASVGARDRLVVGLFGRITAWKGQKILIEALQQLPDVAAVIVGDALFTDEDRQYKRELVALASRLDVDSRIYFAGFQADILPYLNAVDLVVHCSISAEPFGRVIVEASLAGKPVIAARCGGPAEIIEDRVTGILVSPGDPGELARAIKEVQSDRIWAEKLATFGREVAAERFALERILDEWGDFINTTFRGVVKPQVRISEGVRQTSPKQPEVGLTGGAQHAFSDRP